MLSNLNPNYKEIRNKQQLNLLKQQSIKKLVHQPITSEEKVIKENNIVNVEDIYDKKDEKEQLENLLKELSINRNKKKKK
jgi:hypothetical protein